MSKYGRFKGISILFLIVSFFIFIEFNGMANTRLLNRSSSVASGFTIEEYEIILNVDEDNSIDVKENITVDFYESGHHGINRFIPEWLEYTGKDGNTISKKSVVENLFSSTDEYTLDVIDGKKRIRLGSADSYVNGLHTYEIEYTYRMGEDCYENIDEFIFHAYGDFWGTRINNASIEINLPKEIEGEENISFFADKYRKTDITEFVDYEIYGNTIYASVSPEYSLDKSLTIDIELPDGYFAEGETNYGGISLLFCWVCILFAIFSFVLWLKYGKNFGKLPPTVEFYPPEQMDAAEVGYIHKKEIGSTLTIALIVELASKGFVKIFEIEDKKIKVVKADSSADNIEKMTKNEKAVFEGLFNESDEIILSENKKFYKVFDKVATNVIRDLNDKINDVKATKYMAMTAIGCAICTTLWGLSYCVIEDLNPRYSVFYTFAKFSNIITFILSIFMSRKSFYGEQIIAKIEGFKNYIKLAEKEQIEAMAEENPNYFYDILPYAYVLNVSKKWIKKFENIPVPSSDMGNFNYCDINSLNMLSSEVYTPSSDSSSSGCGGGCSSCGGGCSSCGGGSSW